MDSKYRRKYTQHQNISKSQNTDVDGSRVKNVRRIEFSHEDMAMYREKHWYFHYVLGQHCHFMHGGSITKLCSHFILCGEGGHIMQGERTVIIHTERTVALDDADIRFHRIK